MSHPIPDEALDADIATLAKKGSGKTYLNKGLVERLLDLSRRVVVLDPLGVWWGLKALADGSPGYPVVVVGGDHADVTLDAHMGAELAAYVAGADVRMVIDTSGLRSGETVAFATAFFRELYRLNRDPLWLVLEEADVFAPQNPQGLESMMLSEVDAIARRGRSRGFRLWTICQRPQEVNKKTLSQTATMVLMRLMSPQDRKAAEGWLLAHASKEEAGKILQALPSLSVGEGIVLSPELDLLTQATFPTIKTLDNSSTPKAGEKRVGVKALAQVDVAGLRAALVSTDASEGVGSAPAAQAAPAAFTQAAVEEAYEDGRTLGRQEGFDNACEGAMKVIEHKVEALLAEIRVAMAAYRGDLAAQEALIETELGVNAPAIAEAVRASGPIRQPAAEMSTAPKNVNKSDDTSLSGPQRHLLTALAWWREMGHPAPTRTQLAAKAGWAPKGSTLRARLSELHAGKLVEYPATGLVTLTSAGVAAAPSPDLATTLLDSVRGVLSGPQLALFDALETGGVMTRAALAKAVGWEPGGSTLRARLSELHQLEVVEYPAKGSVKLQDWVTT